MCSLMLHTSQTNILSQADLQQLFQMIDTDGILDSSWLGISGHIWATDDTDITTSNRVTTVKTAPLAPVEHPRRPETGAVATETSTEAPAPWSAMSSSSR